MSGNGVAKGPDDPRVQKAVELMLKAPLVLTVSDAMRAAGFIRIDISDRNKQQWIRRRILAKQSLPKQQGHQHNGIVNLLSNAGAPHGGSTLPQMWQRLATQNNAVAANFAAQQGQHGQQGRPPRLPCGAAAAHSPQDLRTLEQPLQRMRLSGMLVNGTEASRSRMNSFAVSPGATAMAAAVLPNAAMPKPTAASVTAAPANRRPNSLSPHTDPASLAAALGRISAESDCSNKASCGGYWAPSSAGPSSASKKPDNHEYSKQLQPYAKIVDEEKTRPNMLRSYGEQNPLFYQRLVQLLGKNAADEMVHEAVNEKINEEIEGNGEKDFKARKVEGSPAQMAMAVNCPANRTSAETMGKYREHDVITIVDTSEEEDEDETNQSATQPQVFPPPTTTVATTAKATVPPPKKVAVEKVLMTPPQATLAPLSRQMPTPFSPIPATQAQVFPPPPTTAVATTAKATVPPPTKVAVEKVSVTVPHAASAPLSLSWAIPTPFNLLPATQAQVFRPPPPTSAATTAKAIVPPPKKAAVEKVLMTPPQAALAPLSRAMPTPPSPLFKSGKTTQDSKKRKGDALPPSSSSSTTRHLDGPKRPKKNPQDLPIPSPGPANGRRSPYNNTPLSLNLGFDRATTATATTTKTTSTEKEDEPPGFDQFKADRKFCGLLFESAKKWKNESADRKLRRSISGLLVLGLLNLDDDELLNSLNDNDLSIRACVKEIILPLLDFPSNLADNEGRWEDCVKISSDNINSLARTVIYQRRKSMKGAVELALYEIRKKHQSLSGGRGGEQNCESKSNNTLNASKSSALTDKDQRIKELEQQIAVGKVKQAKEIKALKDQHLNETKETHGEYTKFVSKLLKSHREKINDLKRGVNDMQNVHKTFLGSYIEASVDALRNNCASPTL